MRGFHQLSQNVAAETVRLSELVITDVAKDPGLASQPSLLPLDGGGEHLIQKMLRTN